MKKAKKLPWLAMILNIVLPGAGYLYVGKRMIFGGLLLGATISGFMWGPSDEAISIISNQWVITSGLLTYIAFAFDAYMEAKNSK